MRQRHNGADWANEQMRVADREREGSWGGKKKKKSVPAVIPLHLDQPQLDVGECESHNKLHLGSAAACYLSGQ